MDRMGGDAITDGNSLYVCANFRHGACTFVPKDDGQGYIEGVVVEIVQVRGADRRGASPDQDLVRGKGRRVDLDQGQSFESFEA
jgi:hypothetical protein